MLVVVDQYFSNSCGLDQNFTTIHSVEAKISLGRQTIFARI